MKREVLVRNVPKNIEALHEHPLLHKIYAARGVIDPEELNYELKFLFPSDQLMGVNEAVNVLMDALKNQLKVLVVGDFDADGATSTALAVLALKAFGLQDISYLIPNRFEYGYGLTPEIVETASRQHPDLIITVDNGITSIDGVAKANELGIKVLITDHHLPGEVLPAAAAIVNPNQLGDQFLSKSLAGVGVIFYLMLALRTYLRDLNWFEDADIAEPNMAQFLDLVALGTVADAVILDRNNRVLVAQGINRIRAGKSRLGIKALFAVGNRDYTKALARDLGFIIAPRLNAAGRLDDMALGVECLLTDDFVKAEEIAKELNVLNDERRGIEQGMQQQAESFIENLRLEQDLPSGLCVFEEGWHQGVLGILAGRLKDKLHRPVVAFAAINDNELKGSVRSISNVHVRDILNNIDIQYPGLLNRFGGHAMAAGLSLMKNNYQKFSEVFAEEVSRVLAQEGSCSLIETDGELEVKHLNLGTAEVLQQAGPWGAGFCEPLFFGNFLVVKQALVGSRHLKLVLRHPDSNKTIDAICFNVDTAIWPNYDCSKIKIVYRLSINEYNNWRNLQLMIDEVMDYE